MNRETRSSVDKEICQYWCFSPVSTHSAVYIDIISVYKGISVCGLTHYKHTHKQKGSVKMHHAQRHLDVLIISQRKSVIISPSSVISTAS